MTYAVKTPWWLRTLLYRKLTWKIKTDTPAVYFTFDDGPHPKATPYVLEQLKQHDAKATFFCIGKNVVSHKDIYDALLAAGHTVGNHTHNHVNGWKTKDSRYITNVAAAANHIKGHLFRPPYGRIRRSQARRLMNATPAWTIYMWDVLSGDFDTALTPQKCADNVISNIRPGSIVVFHDSEKAWERMSYALPLVLAYCKSRNWQINALPQR